MPKAKPERSTSARKEPTEGRPSRRTRKSAAAPKQTQTQAQAQKTLEDKQVQDFEEADEEIPRDLQSNPITQSPDRFAAGENMTLAAPQHPGEAPPGWTYQLVPTNPQGETAGQVAFRMYGDRVNYDSAFVRRLSDKVAVRSTFQRDPENPLNMMRRSNAEAFLAQLTGVRAATPCHSCVTNSGPWTECVVYDGQMCGACSNCWFNASGSRCTFHSKFCFMIQYH